MKLVTFTTIFILILVFLFPAMLALGIRNIPAADQGPLGGTEKIYGTKLITQTFVSADDNLSGIGLSFKNPNLINKDDINFTLMREGIIRNLVINGGSIPDGGFIKFLFEPINGMKNKKFTFSLSAPTATEDKALEVFYSSDSLSYVTFHKVNNKAELIGKVYSHWLYKLSKDIIFFIFYMIITAGLAILLLFHWKKI